VKSCFIGLEVGIKTVELGVGTTKVEMGTLKALFVGRLSEVDIVPVEIGLVTKGRMGKGTVGSCTYMYMLKR
jgi:hypothetical protein